MSDFFWLYRATAPSVRAQSIQVVNAAWATAARGHRVTLAVQAPPKGRWLAADVLDFYGLPANDHLDLRVLSAKNTAASLAFRALFAGWLLRTRGRGIAIARSKRYAREALRRAPGLFRLVIEAHEVDSAQQVELGQDATAMRALEAEVLAGAQAVVCNAPGTLAVLRREHPDLPPAVALHNGTLACRARQPSGRGVGIGYMGSVRREKDLTTVAAAAALLQREVTVIGPDQLSMPWVRSESALPHRDVPDRLSRFDALLLPVGTGLFGEQLTSPLKLWDYLASGVPIVAADTPAIRSAAEGAFEPFRPGDAESLAAAIRRITADDELRARRVAAAPLRTWDQRAEELDVFLASALGAR